MHVGHGAARLAGHQRARDVVPRALAVAGRRAAAHVRVGIPARHQRVLGLAVDAHRDHRSQRGGRGLERVGGAVRALDAPAEAHRVAARPCAGADRRARVAGGRERLLPRALPRGREEHRARAGIGAVRGEPRRRHRARDGHAVAQQPDRDRELAAAQVALRAVERVDRPALALRAACVDAEGERVAHLVARECEPGAGKRAHDLLDDRLAAEAIHLIQALLRHDSAPRALGGAQRADRGHLAREVGDRGRPGRALVHHGVRGECGRVAHRCDRRGRRACGGRGVVHAAQEVVGHDGRRARSGRGPALAAPRAQRLRYRPSVPRLPLDSSAAATFLPSRR